MRKHSLHAILPACYFEKVKAFKNYGANSTAVFERNRTNTGTNTQRTVLLVPSPEFN